MKTALPLALLLACCLALPAGPDGAARAQEGSGDEVGVPSGPVTRRPPERRVAPAPKPPVPDAPEAAGAPAGDEAAAEPARERRVLEVLDAGVLEGVFAPYVIRDGREIPQPLTAAAGNPVAGRRLYHNSSRTGCSLCHDTAEAPRAPDSDRTAPPLYRVAERLTPARLRLWIVAPATIHPDTTMPAFHKPGQRENPWDPLYGGPRLTASEVEDVVAYLGRAGMPKNGD